MSSSRRVLGVAVILVSMSPTRSLPAQEALGTERAAVLAVVDSFIAGMTRLDPVASRKTLAPNAMFYSMAPGRPMRAVSDTAYLNSLGAQPRTLQERIWNPVVLVHGWMAEIWSPYDFHVDGKFSHCGVDSWSLLRTEVGWQIVAVTYTIETSGCPASPLGPIRQP